MKKTVSLLAVLLVLGALLLTGWKWMASMPSERASNGLAPPMPEAPVAPVDEDSRLEAPPRDQAIEKAEPQAAPPPPPLPTFVVRGVTGRVIDTAGTPVPSAKVTSSLNGEWARSHWNWTRCDENGKYSFDLDLAELVGEEFARRQQVVNWLERCARDEGSADAQRWNNLSLERRRETLSGLEQPLVLEVSARASDDRRTTRRLLLGSSPPALVRLDLIVEARAVIRGRVTKGHWGVGEADVALLDDDWQVVSATKTDTRSYFEFTEPEPALHRVHARRRGHGAVVISGHHLDPAFSSALVRLELEGAATLSGQLMMPDGTPVDDVELVCLLESLVSSDLTGGVWPERSVLAQAEEAGGLALANAVTDREGRFEMEALQEGRYALRFEGLGARHQPEGLFNTGGEQEVIFPARLLQARILAPDVVVMRSRVHCEEITALEPLPGARRRHFARTPERGVARFVVDSGTTWRVWVEYRGYLSEERTIDIGDSSYLEEVTFELDGSEAEEDPLAVEPPPPKYPGTLTVDLADEKGQRYPTAVTLWRIEVGGRTRLHDWLSRMVDEPLPALEAGEYEVTVRAIGEAGEMLLPVTGTESIQVLAGKERRVSFEAERGGRLVLQLSVGGLDPENSSRGTIQASLIPEDGRASPIPLRFRAESPGERPSATLIPGGTVTCEPALPAGHYSLQLLSDSFEAELIPVAIEAGETTRTEVVLFERDSGQD